MTIKRRGEASADGTVNPSMPGADWDVSFADENGRTLVTTLVQSGSSPGRQAALDMGLKDGLASTLERLDELLPRLQDQPAQ
jgi:uncharacterized protein YndB with AHSA1/START domain